MLVGEVSLGYLRDMRVHYFLTCFRCGIMGFFPLKNIDQKIVISFY